MTQNVVRVGGGDVVTMEGFDDGNTYTALGLIEGSNVV